MERISQPQSPPLEVIKVPELESWFWLNTIRSVGIVLTLLALYRSLKYRRHWSLIVGLLCWGYYLLTAISDPFYRQIPLTVPIAVAHGGWWVIAGRLALPRRKRMIFYPSPEVLHGKGTHSK